MKVSDITAALESYAPRELQESYDNSGLIVGSPDQEVRGVLVCLDSTPEIIEEAVRKRCNLVIAHHPIIFGGLKSLTGANYIEQTVIRAIRNDIAIYAIHTNLDNVLGNGVNGKIAERLGLIETSTLRPARQADVLDDETGAGVIGMLPETMTEEEFLAFLKAQMKATVVRHTRLRNTPVSRVAVCGGSGSFLLDDAIAGNADVFVTGDFKYHNFFDANDRIVIMDIGHYESEQFTVQLIGELLRRKFRNFAPNFAETNTNPVNYYT